MCSCSVFVLCCAVWYDFISHPVRRTLLRCIESCVAIRHSRLQHVGCNIVATMLQRAVLCWNAAPSSEASAAGGVAAGASTCVAAWLHHSPHAPRSRPSSMCCIATQHVAARCNVVCCDTCLAAGCSPHRRAAARLGRQPRRSQLLRNGSHLNRRQREA